MDKYDAWLEASWRKLVDDFLSRSFRPQNESDIKCHLYCSLLQTKPQIKGLTPDHLVMSEFQLPASLEKVDLALVRWRSREEAPHPRLTIELKESSQVHLSASEVEERIRDDIDKLRRYRKMLEEKKETKILKFFKKPAVAFFFRGASRHGIGVRTEQEMRKLKEKYADITFLYGPC